MTRISETPQDEAEWSAARREFLADERDRIADRRDEVADERESDADARELAADLRESDLVAGRLDISDSSVANREEGRAARGQARAARQHAVWDRDEARLRRAEIRALRSTDAPTVLAKLFADIARQLFEPGSLEAVLLRVATVATDLVPGCEYASITLSSSRGPLTPVATDDVAKAADKRQYDAGEGPCLDAMTERWIYTVDLGSDPRWPHVDADGLAVRTVASFGLYESWKGGEPEGARASLNLYGSSVDAIPHEGHELGLLLAAYGSVAVSVAAERERARQRDDDLRAALLSRDVIGQAKGILMERDKVTADEAFNVLRRTSQACNRKLRDIADRLAMTGELPPVE